MNKKLLLWDADALCYMGRKEETVADILYKVDCKIHDILEFSGADAYVLFISEGRYFRYDLATSKEDNRSTYKAKRSIPTQPYTKVVREYLKSHYGAISYKGLEADDAVVYWNKKNFFYCNTTGYSDRGCVANGSLEKDDVDTIIVATDKDVLGNTVGKHINPSKKNPKTGEYETIWVETDEAKANKHFWSQMVCGDTVDGIAGIKGKGKSFFDKEIVGRGGAETYFILVLKEYIKTHGEAKGIFEFQKNYRLLKMIDSDELMLQEIGYIPSIPEVNIVDKVNDEINLDII